MSAPSHYLIITYPSWAHIRSLIGLTTSLLELNAELLVTMLVPSNRAAAATLEMRQYPAVKNPARWRIIHYGEKAEEAVLVNPPGGYVVKCLNELAPLVESISDLQPVLDPVTEEHLSPHQTPFTIIITDGTLRTFGFAIADYLSREQPEIRRVPVFGFLPYNTALPAVMFLDKYSQLSQRLAVVVEEKEPGKRRALYDELTGCNSDVISLPGLSDFYYYETDIVPHASPFPILDRWVSVVKQVPEGFDGIIMGWPYIFGEALQVDLEERHGKFLQVGPQLPPIVQDEWKIETKQGDTKAYLDNALQNLGPRSVLYISFGSATYAPTHEQLEILLFVLEELQLHYIITEGQCRPEDKQALLDRVGKGNDKGLFVPWAPQRAVLSHPAINLFLTHGGSNSTMESILFKVPMITWPAGFDQPYIANELDHLGVAVEILQTRGGGSIGRPVARNGTIVEGTAAAIEAEMKRLLGDTQLHERLRTRIQEVSGRVKENRASGESGEAVKRIAKIDQEWASDRAARG
ncbi:hypothetical protein P7C73_g5543, partial [Tremellales sp. Uapishka_1]